MLVHRVDDRAIARLVILLSEHLADLGVEMTVLAVAADPEPLRRVPPSVRVVVVGAPLDRTLASVFNLAAALRRLRPDVLFAHGNGPNRTAVLARAIAAVHTRVVTVEHNHYSTYISPSGGGYSHPRLRDWMTRRLYDRADVVAGVVPRIVEDLVDRFDGVGWTTRVLPDPGRDPDEIARLAAGPVEHPWCAEPRDHDLVCSVANVIPRKGIHVLVEALPRIRERVGDVRLVVVGRKDQSDYMARMERSAARLGVEGAIAFVGFRDNPIAWMARADVFALTSFNEGCPRVLSEAMMAGIPVVASECPAGPAYILEQGRAGLLVSMGDSEETAEAIASILLDPTLRRRLVERGRERAKQFAPRRVAKAYLAVARELTAARAS